jgi:hypothetical protein
MQAQMLAPAAVLVAWSLVMLFWLAGSRFSAIAKSGIDMKAGPPGGRGQNLEGVLPDKANWKAHNYAHLMEQPTIFYPAVVIIALLGAGEWDVMAAWAYVALRIIHSVYQATVNVVMVRFSIFLVSTLFLVYLAYRAVALTLFHNPGVIA